MTPPRSMSRHDAAGRSSRSVVMRKASATVTTTAKARISESPKNRQMPSWSVITLMRLCAPHKVRCSCGDATIAWGFYLIGFKSNNRSSDASNASCRVVNAVSKSKPISQTVAVRMRKAGLPPRTAILSCLDSEKM